MPSKKNKPKKQPPKPELAPGPDFEDALKKVLETSKEESDRQLAEFQASNKARREGRKPKS